MKTFAEYLPTMTARERDIVMAYERAMVYARDADPNTATPFELLLATPPAKDPVSITGKIYDLDDDPESGEWGGVDWDAPPQDVLPAGTKVKLVEIEETT